MQRLTDEQFGHAAFCRQLDGKLRELRFSMGRDQTRISHDIATGRRIVLLTGVPQGTAPRGGGDQQGSHGDAALHGRGAHRR
jgi:hypothetical protein